MALLVVFAVIVALLTGMTLVISKRQRRGTGRNVHGDAHTADQLSNEWKWKSHMGGGGGHQGGSPGL